MCGLFGFIVPQKPLNAHFMDKKHFVQEAMYMSTLRGGESAGIACVTDPYKPPIVYKKAIYPPDFLQLRTTERILSDVERYHAVLGHTRSSTRGKVSDQNAHPFVCDNITMIHNGTVHNSWQLSRNTPAGMDVDSAHVCHAFAEGDPKEVLEKINGDYCFVWHDSAKGTINIAKNQGRPLFWAQIPEWRALAFMSEKGALGYILSRHQIKIKDIFWYPKNEVIYTYHLDTDDLKFDMTPFKHAVTRVRGSPRSVAGTGGPERGKETTVLGPHQTPGGAEETISDVIARKSLSKRSPNTGRPTSKKGIKKAQAKLKALGLSYDTTYGAVPKAFIPYKNQTEYGYIILIMQGIKHKGMLAEMHNVKKSTFEMLVDRVEDKLSVVAKAVNVQTERGGHEQSIILELNPKYIGGLVEEEEVPPTDLEFAAAQRSKPGPVVSKIIQDYKDADGAAIETIHGPYGMYVTTKTWLNLTSDGCSFCGKQLDLSQAEKITWIGLEKKQPVCTECQGVEQVQKDIKIISEADRNHHG